jgi:hypothetical protein
LIAGHEQNQVGVFGDTQMVEVVGAIGRNYGKAFRVHAGFRLSPASGIENQFLGSLDSSDDILAATPLLPVT